VVRQGIIETLKPLLFEASSTNPDARTAVIIFLAGAASGCIDIPLPGPKRP
jgi:hypothetical protein